jgi:hypothetical protein
MSETIALIFRVPKRILISTSLVFNSSDRILVRPLPIFYRSLLIFNPATIILNTAMRFFGLSLILGRRWRMLGA